MYSANDISLLSDCITCPRSCHVNRFEGGTGWCKTDAGLNVASICIHKGEEPVISGPSGICNVFFSGCNLKCIFCQNHEISQPAINFKKNEQKISDIADTIQGILQKGVKSLGFVSPSHMTVQMKAIIEAIHERGLKPAIIYNTNGYDKVETLRSLQDIVNIYLPDFKYMTPGIASGYSRASHYPEVALKALKEMYWQKGSTLSLDEEGRAENGLLIRHLVLPGHVEESKKVLRTIAEELSTGVNISLMSQYHPAWKAVTRAPLDRTLYKEEYEEVVSEMNSLGFRNGWVQGMDSHLNYLPDFSKENPFEA
jgi:putative pyruvate formate lyase activating enzyme